MSCLRRAIFGSASAALILVGFIAFFARDSRAPRELYQACYRVEIPRGARNVSARWVNRATLVIQFELPPKNLTEFLAHAAPGCGPWRHKFGEFVPVEIEDVFTNESETLVAEHPQENNETWTFVVDISKRTVFAIHIDLGPFI